MRSLRILSSFFVLACVAAALAGCGSSPHASAATPPAHVDNQRVHAEAQVRFRVPDQWTVDESEPGILTMLAPDDSIGLSMFVVEAADLRTALDAIRGGVLTELEQVVFDGEPEEGELHGMPATFVDGHGVADGGAVELGIGALHTPSGKFLLLVGMASEGALATHQPTVDEILDSIQPI